jgi:hypothetical protein
MLAYVFWHQPVAGVQPSAYQDSLVAFHRAMKAHPPAGYHGSAAFAFDGAPWFGAGYLDWYLVEDFASLGSINEAAIAGARQQPHDVVASLAGSGAGGVMRLAAGNAALDSIRRGVWFSKPDGMRYGSFLQRAAAFADRAGATLWQRQMVLGPGPEFCLFTAEPAPIPAEFSPVVLHLRNVFPPSTRNS